MSLDQKNRQGPLTENQLRVVRDKLKRAEASGFTDQGPQEILNEIRSR